MPFRVLTSTTLSWNAKISNIIEGARLLFNPMSALPDHYIWNGHSLGRFSINLAWEVFKDSKLTDSMHHLFKFSYFILRLSFIMWLAFLGRLNTMVRLLVFQIILSSTCNPLWVAGWNTWIFILLIPFLYYSLGCYHIHNLYRLAFFNVV